MMGIKTTGATQAMACSGTVTTGVSRLLHRVEAQLPS
jgi:hypothetical protein